MAALTRRGFVEAVSLTIGLGTASAPPDASASPAHAAPDADGARHVMLSGDGVGLTPRQYTTLLQQLCQAREVRDDSYLLGGEIEAFERHWATLLGKETAVYMPSGTLANQLALRALAGVKRRVIVPETSHIYNDTGDACQTLSGLTLLPLGANAATFTRDDVEGVLTRTAGGRVATEVGAIAIESPIRRLSGQMFDWNQARRITTFARERGIGTHLDGARLFIASAYTGLTPAEYAAPFDTVYVSLWKYFNCGQGAILAGPRRVLDGMFHTRRMFGGNLAAGWPSAVIARHYMDGFVDRLRTAVRTSEDVYTRLASHPRLSIERIPQGTNVARVTIRGADPAVVARRLGEDGIHLPTASPAGVVTLGVNETWARRSAAALTEAFTRALA